MSFIDPNTVMDIENFLQGLLTGASFIGQVDCTNSLSDVITYSADLIQAGTTLAASAPAASLIAFNSLNTATGNMYANCDANQLYNQFASLMNFSQSTNEIIDVYGRLGSRILGVLTNKAWVAKRCIQKGFQNDDTYSAGKCTGDLFSAVFDSIL